MLRAVCCARCDSAAIVSGSMRSGARCMRGKRATAATPLGLSESLLKPSVLGLPGVEVPGANCTETEAATSWSCGEGPASFVLEPECSGLLLEASGSSGSRTLSPLVVYPGPPGEFTLKFEFDTRVTNGGAEGVPDPPALWLLVVSVLLSWWWPEWFEWCRCKDDLWLWVVVRRAWGVLVARAVEGSLVSSLIS